MERSSGVLMHITSLPGKYGIGTMGKEAERFADFCRQAGLRYWQVLPIGPVGSSNSPYQSDSVFAGNPDFIDPEQLIAQGLLTQKECERLDWGRGERVCFEKAAAAKQTVLRLAFARAKQMPIWREVELFFQQESEWLADYSLYRAIREEKNGAAWQTWEAGLRSRDAKILEEYRRRLQQETEYHSFVQYLFDTQWRHLKEYCNRQGVLLIGDIPIYVAQDSCDTWVNPQLFEYDEQFQPIRVAGCPPDYFSKTGQLWGNPLYRWDRMEQENFAWWKKRFAALEKRFDLTRIDHFRGFAGYYAVDAAEKTAENGRWETGPGKQLFACIKKELPNLKLIAEDLGVITEDVEQLREWCGFPGMKILQFAFSSREESSYLPHRCPQKAVIYTGTHDNNTCLGWAEELNEQDWSTVKAYTGAKRKKEIAWEMIRTAWTSPCELAIAPMQDFLSLPAKARMNTPSTVGGNWEWRMKKNAANPQLARQIAQLNRAAWRFPKSKRKIKAVIKTKKQ